MATATIVNAWHDGTTAFVVARVEGDSLSAAVGALGEQPAQAPVAVEYGASTSLRDGGGGVKSAQALRADLLAALKAERARSKALETPPDRTEISLTGTVDI